MGRHLISVVLLAMLGVCASVWPRHEAAAIRLEVRSATAFSEIEISPWGLRPQIRGRLIDNLSVGIANVRIELLFVNTATGKTMRQPWVMTDRLGYFEYGGERAEPLAAGRYKVTMVFTPVNGVFYKAAQVSRSIEVARATMSWEVTTPAVVHVQEGARVRLEGRAVPSWPGGRWPAAKPTLQLSAGTPVVQQKALTLDEAGTFDWSMSSLDFDTRGLQSLTLRFAGDDYFEPHMMTREVMVYISPRLELTATRVRERARRGVVVAGRVSSVDGPLVGAQVQFEASAMPRGEALMWRTLGQVRADEEGRFEAFLEEDGLPLGNVGIRAVLVPDVGKRFYGDPAQLEIEAGGLGEVVPWILLSLLALAALSALMYRGVDQLRGLWERFKRWRKPPTRRVVATPVVLEDVPEDVSALPTGIAGRVCDSVEGWTIAGATVRLVRVGAEPSADAVASVVCGEAGGFRMNDLPNGRYTLWGMAEGYMTTPLKVKIPHDGTLRFFRFDLVPVRERVRELYAWLLEHYAPEEQLWGQETPRELRDQIFALMDDVPVLSLPDDRVLASLEQLREVLQGRPSLGELLQALTRALEEIYYSPRRYPEQVLDVIEALTEQLRKPLVALGQQRQDQQRHRHADPGGPRIWMGGS